MYTSLDGAHLGWLAPVRMLIIALIAFGYASTLPLGPNKEEYLNVLGYDPSWYGISLLFMISGYLALKSLRRHGSPFKFLVSRIGRNLPTLTIFAGLVVLVIFPLFAAPLGASGARAEQHLAYLFKVLTCIDPDALTPGLLDNALYMCIIQGGIWTFRWGVVAYVGTALIWALGGLRHNFTLLLLTLSVGVLYGALIIRGLDNPHPALNFIIIGLRMGWPFLAGMFAYAYKTRLPRSFIVPALLLIAAIAQYTFLPWTPYIEITAELALGYFVFLGITSRVAVPKWLQKIPDLSLGLYIYNWPAAQITLLLVPNLTPIGLFSISMPVTIALSALTWIMVSQPINHKLALKLSTPMH